MPKQTSVQSSCCFLDFRPYIFLKKDFGLCEHYTVWPY